MKIEIYSKDNCPFCDMAIAYVEKAQRDPVNAEARSLQLEVFKLGEDFQREELMKKFPTARTFPQITLDGNAIGGWDQLKTHSL